MKPRDLRKYYVWLSLACGQGSKCAVSLMREFGGAYEIYCAGEEEYALCDFKIDSKIKSRLLYKELFDAEDIVRWCDETGVRIMCPDDMDYPRALKSLRDAPMVLYMIGNLPDFDNTFSCAVVGTRSMSEYGSKISYKIGYGLASGGACLISGLAKGCDAMAMRGALDAGGTSVAVLGCGIDIVYPKENQALYERAISRGAIITEYAPGVSPIGSHFPVRNRIISGISQAACVVEGNMRSGALITARHAIYQGRDLFAVPGNADTDGAEGTNHLIKQGAFAATNAEDILSHYEFIYPHTIDLKKAVSNKLIPSDDGEVIILETKKTKAPKKAKKVKKIKEKPFKVEEESNKPVNKTIDFDMLGETEKEVYRVMLPDIPMLAEEICRVGNLPIATVMASLTILEIAGAVEAGAGGYFMRHCDDEEVGEPAITEYDSALL